MSRPANLNTKIFLDGGIPEQSREVVGLLGFLDGQTTNPSLITRHPKFIECQQARRGCSEQAAWGYYREIVEEISPLVAGGSVSIEVYADSQTTAETMIERGRELFGWVANAHVKLPCTRAGLQAAQVLVKEGVRVNMTLVFTQAQAAAVYSATQGAARGSVFVSPFVGRLDDQGQDGMSLIANILKMYQEGDGQVEVLVASVRSQEHILQTLKLGADIITIPYKLMQAWIGGGQLLPDPEFVYSSAGLSVIQYQDLDLAAPWQSFDIKHPLTSQGLAKFAQDWNHTLSKNVSR